MIKSRIERIKNGLGMHEAALIKSGPNRFYFTGFNSSAGTVFVTKSNAYFLIDFRYFEKAKKTVNGCEVMLSNRDNAEILKLANSNGINLIYVETESVSIGEFERIKADLGGIEISRSDKLDSLIFDMRSIKQAEELKNIKLAQGITDKTFSYILNNIKPRRTEKEIMLDMEFYLRKLGSEGVAFDFIVVSGKNSSLPHGVPSDKKIEIGDFITMDFGATVNGYRSDMTRTVAVGSVSDEQKKVYDTVLKAQLAAIDAVKPGVICKDIDKIARDIIYGAGYEGCFGHGLGHSVGIEIHESPNFNTRCDTVLRQGTVMTVEPGIYLENKFGVRIEDMVYVTDIGCENITKSSKELIII